MSARSVRFEFSRLWPGGESRPLVWARIVNAHDPKRIQFVPALIDTGADRSAAPVGLCAELGHAFESGNQRPDASGVGNGAVRSFAHGCLLSILNVSGDGLPDPQDTLFGPFQMSLEFIDQDLPFILLGQSDFLEHFGYRQTRADGWFSLRTIRWEADA